MNSALFTWRDVERLLEKVGNPPWVTAESDPCTISIKCPKTHRGAVERTLRKIFGPRFAGEKLRLESLPERERFLDVEILEGFEKKLTQRIIRPLWSDALQPGEELTEASTVRVAAFYSYKGGVGRTTCLLATASSLLKNGSSILIVDADLEAPGLTWNLPGAPDRLSLLDALGLIHDEENWQDLAVPLIAAHLRRNRETIELPSGKASFYFLPAFRDFEQIFSMPVSLEQLVRTRGRKYIVYEALTKIGEELGIDAVLVDLRAGVTEFSSPLLLDRRVQSFLVTSCNQQSIEGTAEILSRMRYRVSSATSPEIVLSMVPPGEPEALSNEMAERLFSAFPISSDEAAELSLRTHTVKFAQELLHYTSVEELLARRISGTDLGKTVGPDLAALLMPSPDGAGEEKIVRQEASIGLKRVIEEAKRLEYAETSGSGGLLPTNALVALVETSNTSLPATVVLGSKGAGKTFAWLQIVAAGTWREFCQRVQAGSPSSTDGLVFPLLSPINLDKDGRQAVRAAEDKVWAKTSPGTDGNDLRTALERLGEGLEDANSAAFWPSWVAARLGLSRGRGWQCGVTGRSPRRARMPYCFSFRRV